MTSSVVERCPDKTEVAGSIPASPTNLKNRSPFGFLNFMHFGIEPSIAPYQEDPSGARVRNRRCLKRGPGRDGKVRQASGPTGRERSGIPASPTKFKKTEVRIRGREFS